MFNVYVSVHILHLQLAYNSAYKYSNFNNNWVDLNIVAKEVGVPLEELQKLMECLRTEILDELMGGNSVELFELVKLRPDYSIRDNSAGEESDIEESLASLTPHDVKSSLRANVNQSFNHEYVRLFRKKNLATLF